MNQSDKGDSLEKSTVPFGSLSKVERIYLAGSDGREVVLFCVISESDEGLVGEARAGWGHRVTGVRARLKKVGKRRK